MARAEGAGGERFGRAALGETLSLVRRYVLQETVGPLKHLGRTLGFGIAGAFLIGLGALLALLGVLRVLQGETGTTFANRWSFAPYLLTAALGVLLAAGSVALSLRNRRGDRTPLEGS